jgi:PAS domain S-box-containing protein
MKPETLLEKQGKEILTYKHALDESSIVAITDQRGIITYANDNFCKISKYSREELVGQDHRIINSGYHPKAFMKQLWTTIANGNIWKGEIRNKAKDGTFYWVDTTIVPFLNEEGKPFQYLGIRSDITDQKKAEEKYRILFDSIDEGFCVIEMIFDEQQKPVDYRFLEINASFEKQTGMHNAVGKRMREFAPDHEEHWFEIYGHIALTGEPIRFENRAEQLHRWYDVYAFRFGNPKNKQVAILFKDITERKAAEEQLLQVNKELESFSYSVAHDLRTPLRLTHSYAEMLKQENAHVLDEEAIRIVENIKYNALKMNRLIDDLLAFSRLGRKELQLHKIDMNILVREVLVEITTSMAPKAEIVVDKLPEATGDYNLVYQVMFNLISNAVKYSSKKEHPVIHISSSSKNKEHEYSVKDNGAGFNTKYANKLFSVFQRLHTEREFEGTGIGLAIVHRIITKHGGTVRAEGKVNEGATFYFTIPDAGSA